MPQFETYRVGTDLRVIDKTDDIPVAIVPMRDVPRADVERDFATDDSTEPCRFTTLAAIRHAWMERDILYSLAHRMNEEAVLAVREYRKAEVNDLPPGDRARAWAEANCWVQPVG